MGKINRRLTFLFLLIGIVAPTIGIFYFYSLSSSLIIPNPEVFNEELLILESTALVIIILIAINAGFLGFFISYSITKPIKQLHNAAKEIEKGNFDIRVDIKTNDEIAKLGNAINMSAVALGKMKEERKQLDKAKSEFLSITSHELKTPITPLVVQLQMMQQQYFGKLTEKQKKSLEIVLRNTERLSKMIEDFLEVSRIEAARLKFNFKKSNLNETLEETVGLMSGYANEKNIKLVLNVDRLPIFEFDPDRTSQVLRNLINNAIKFSNINSKIEITATSDKKQIIIGVKDYGIGISPKDQIRVFEPFYQTGDSINRKHEGTGLGLAICRGIIESQKCKIWVESTLGQGSIFYFTLPLKPVKDIEPIKVLFSLKSEIEKELKEEFILKLGPMGMAEFDDLKNKNSIEKLSLMDYVDELEELNIISDSIANDFKINIGKIFGENITDEEFEKEVLKVEQ